MTENRQWHLARLSTPTALRILTTLGKLPEPIGAVALSMAAGASETTTRECLSRAIRVGLAVRHDGDRPTDAGRFTLTPEGRQHITHCRPVIDDDAAANDVDDQSSSTTMTIRPPRRGKPGWCTPGKGVCRGCEEPS